MRISNDEIQTVLGHFLEYNIVVEVDRRATALAVGVRDDLAPLLSTLRLPLLPLVESQLRDTPQSFGDGSL